LLLGTPTRLASAVGADGGVTVVGYGHERFQLLRLLLQQSFCCCCSYRRCNNVAGIGGLLLMPPTE